MEKSYLDISYLSLFLSCTFKVIMFFISDVLEESYIFAVLMDPFQTSYLAPYILNTPCVLNWRLKCMEMTKCLENCRFDQTIISNFSSKLKLKMMFKKCSNCHWFILRGFYFVKKVYELFDNPSYLYFIWIDVFFKLLRIYSLIDRQFYAIFHLSYHLKKNNFLRLLCLLSESIILNLILVITHQNFTGLLLISPNFKKSNLYIM